jgi:hypothetical protein
MKTIKIKTNADKDGQAQIKEALKLWGLRAKFVDDEADLRVSYIASNPTLVARGTIYGYYMDNIAIFTSNIERDKINIVRVIAHEIGHWLGYTEGHGIMTQDPRFMTDELPDYPASQLAQYDNSGQVPNNLKQINVHTRYTPQEESDDGME